MLSVDDLIPGTRIICTDKTSANIGKIAVINSAKKYGDNDYDIYITWDDSGKLSCWPWSSFSRYMTDDLITTKACSHCGCYNKPDSISCWFCKEKPC